MGLGNKQLLFPRACLYCLGSLQYLCYDQEKQKCLSVKGNNINLIKPKVILHRKLPRKWHFTKYVSLAVLLGKVTARNPYPSVGLAPLCTQACRSPRVCVFLELFIGSISLWIWERTRSASKCPRFINNILINSRGFRCVVFLLWLLLGGKTKIIRKG